MEQSVASSLEGMLIVRLGWVGGQRSGRVQSNSMESLTCAESVWPVESHLSKANHCVDQQLSRRYGKKERMS